MVKNVMFPHSNNFMAVHIKKHKNNYKSISLKIIIFKNSQKLIVYRILRIELSAYLCAIYKYFF